ncbi:MAG: hypothetical protein H0T69_07095 [Thermoleophilaceae bacterium]|nr:hypothetical protein [Thermoleophilaceae bacterium]
MSAIALGLFWSLIGAGMLAWGRRSPVAAGLLMFFAVPLLGAPLLALRLFRIYRSAPEDEYDKLRREREERKAGSITTGRLAVTPTEQPLRLSGAVKTCS